MTPARTDIDPELAVGRANESALIAALIRIATDLSVLDPEALDADAATATAAGGALVFMLKQSIEILATLEQLQQPVHGDHETLRDLDSEPCASVRALTLSPPKLEDVCIAGALELNQALRELTRARDLDQMCAAAETARRKLGRAIHAVLRQVQDTSVADAAGSVLGGTRTPVRPPRSPR